MSKKTWRSSAPERKTLPLRGTVTKTQANLDHRSALGLAYAQVWLQRHGSPKPPGSGVIRRALAVYLNHLSTNQDPRAEARAVASVCQSMTPDEDDQQEAWDRLQSITEAVPLPPWPEVASRPERIAAFHALNERSEALFNQVMKERSDRR